MLYRACRYCCPVSSEDESTHLRRGFFRAVAIFYFFIFFHVGVQYSKKLFYCSTNPAVNLRLRPCPHQLEMYECRVLRAGDI